MSGEYLIVQAAAALLLYLILKNRFIAMADPLRMRLADLGKKVLSDPNLDAQDRERIEFQLDHAYNGWIAWAFVVLLPISAVRSLWDSFSGRTKAGPVTHKSDSNAITLLATISVFASSPLAAIIFALEFILLAVLFVPVWTALRYTGDMLASTENSLHRVRVHVTHN